MNIISRIVNQGTQNSADTASNKHTKVTNWIALLVCFFILQNMLVSVYFGVIQLAIIQLLNCLLLCLVPAFNSMGKRLLATTWFSGVMIFFLTIYGLTNSLDTNTIFYFPLMVFVLFFLFPASERGYVFLLVGLVIICFTGSFLWHYLSTPPLFPVPTGFNDGQRWNAILGVPFLSGAFGAYAFYAINHAEQEVAREKEKTEQLLLNILPPSVAERFKNDQSLLAEGFESVTVLFADIADFTALSTQLSPDEVVRFLNTLFSEFDRLAELYGLEKIKTIGDAYMVAGGVPEPSSDHTRKVCAMAIGMREIVGNMKRPDGAPLYIRIGINTGPVTAGVIGVKKFIYDLWGDTVNTASRMESHAEEGHIQVTEKVYQILKAECEFRPRGTIQVKGKGAMETYFLTGMQGAYEASARRGQSNPN